MTVDNHSSLQVRIKKVDVHGETGLTASRTVQKGINHLQLTEKSNGKKKYLVKKLDLLFFSFFDVSLTNGVLFRRTLHEIFT